MDQNKKGSTNTRLTCDVCKIDFVSNADYALHEFSKKHCDNLIRLARNKPIVSKHKTKNEVQPVEKEIPKVNTVTHTGSFAKYGYFVPGEIYRTPEISREFNTEYDPYLQKFAENPFKEETTSVGGESQRIPTSTPCSNVSFCRKKKKKIKTCQICNVTLETVPEYEVHMKSPQHIWKLKVTGMGVSAHFVKASADLHTTDLNEETKPADQKEDNLSLNLSTGTENTSGPFPLLYCSDCELLLNSPQQYNAHIVGKSHLECAQRKAELKAKKEKLQNPVPNKLYCYSCKISLNNLFQYNEHKNGKKHKTKCKQLIRRGITIPPEERFPELTASKPNPNKPVIYPELYEKFVVEKQRESKTESKDLLDFPIETSQKMSQQSLGVLDASLNIAGETYHCNTCSETFQTVSSFNYHIQTKEHIDLSLNLPETQKVVADSSVSLHSMVIQNDKTPVEVEHVKPNIDSHLNNEAAHEHFRLSHEAPVEEVTSDSNSLTWHNTSSVASMNDTAADIIDDKVKCKSENCNSQITIVTDNSPLRCSICNLNFDWQLQFDKHLTTEDHFKKILQLKLNGESESEILNKIFTDRKFIKSDSSGKFSCSICNVTTVNKKEFEQHMNSIVHKYTQKDYKTKRTVEVKHIIAGNENNLYFCKLCNEGWSSLLDFTQHLHFLKHKITQRAERAKKLVAKRKSLFLQKQRLMQHLNGKNFSTRRLRIEKNPGVRTKICGVATDLSTGAQAPVPNLEPLEPKIDPIKNIHLGVCEKSKVKILDSKVTPAEASNVKKRRRMPHSNQKPRSVGNQQSSTIHPKQIPPLIPRSVDSIPPLMPPSPFQQLPQRSNPNYFGASRNWVPYFNPYPPRFGPFCGLGPGPRPPWFHRPRWPKNLGGPHNFH